MRFCKHFCRKKAAVACGRFRFWLRSVRFLHGLRGTFPVSCGFLRFQHRRQRRLEPHKWNSGITVCQCVNKLLISCSDNAVFFLFPDSTQLTTVAAVTAMVGSATSIGILICIIVLTRRRRSLAEPRLKFFLKILCCCLFIYFTVSSFLCF